MAYLLQYRAEITDIEKLIKFLSADGNTEGFRDGLPHRFTITLIPCAGIHDESKCPCEALLEFISLAYRQIIDRGNRLFRRGSLFLGQEPIFQQIALICLDVRRGDIACRVLGNDKMTAGEDQKGEYEGSEQEENRSPDRLFSTALNHFPEVGQQSFALRGKINCLAAFCGIFCGIGWHTLLLNPHRATGTLKLKQKFNYNLYNPALSTETASQPSGSPSPAFRFSHSNQNVV